MHRSHVVFVPDKAHMERTLRGLKNAACPFCRKLGTLNRHSKLYGNDTAEVKGRLLRGQRVLCAKRGRRGGCGRSFPVLLDWVFPRHTFTAMLFWNGLAGWLAGSSIKAAWEVSRIPMALDSLYHLVQRLRRRLPTLRSALARLGPPPASRSADPMLQTLAHLQAVFPDSVCPAQTFQRRIQKPLTG